MIARLLRNTLAAPVRLSLIGMQRGPHIWRYSMYRRLAHLFSNIERRADAKVLAISGSERLCSTIGFAPRAAHGGELSAV